ncbi:MAG: hypothetical protein ABFD82_07975 [Syntrophaceae bacterium]
MRKLFYGILLVFLSCAASYSMTYEQMLNLGGADMLGERVDVLLKNYGLPTSMVDHGITTAMPQKKIEWDYHVLMLTEGDWNLIYSAKGDTRADASSRINNKRIFPGQFAALKVIVFYSEGNKMLFSFDSKQNKFIEKKPKTQFEAHMIYRISAFFDLSITIEEIKRLYGMYDEKVRDDSMREVLRYSVIEWGKNDYPSVAYRVDFPTNGYSVGGYNISYDTKKWNALLNKWLREHPPAAPAPVPAPINPNIKWDE